MALDDPRQVRVPGAQLRNPAVQGAVPCLCRTDEALARLSEIFRPKSVSLAREHVVLAVGPLTRGFRVPDLGLTVISNVEFAGVPQPVRVRERAALPTVAIQARALAE